MNTAPIAVGDLVRFATSEKEWRVTAVSAKGDLADLSPAPFYFETSNSPRRRRVATSRLVRLGR